MSFMYLTQVSGLLKPFAWVMGEILNAIYSVCASIGFANIALCIVIFTIVVKMLMLPLTIKQQKFSKVSAKMNPEIQALQKKYANADRSNQAVMAKMQQEQQEIYKKYGTSPFGGCLPLLITLPIMFALYRVIYAIPAYVDDVNAKYVQITKPIINEYSNDKDEFDYVKALEEFCKSHGLSVKDNSKSLEDKTNYLIDMLSVFNSTAWSDFESGKAIDGCKNWNAMVATPEFKQIMNDQSETVDEIIEINQFFGKFNILDNPGLKFPLVILPILAAALQFLQVKITTAASKNKDKPNEPNPMDSMKMMNTIMPIMSGVFCVFLPIGVGIYWVANSVVTIGQQVVINIYLDKKGIDDIVEENEKKRQEKIEKMGVISKDNTMSTIAKSSTKQISNNGNAERTGENIPTPATGSISSIANIMKNSKKED